MEATQRHQYIRKSRQLKFAKLGAPISTLNRDLQALIEQHGLSTWDEYKARQGALEAAREPLQRPFLRCAAARFMGEQRRARRQRERDRRLASLKQQLRAARQAHAQHPPTARLNVLFFLSLRGLYSD
ncbi:hypothetical protein E2562_002594 [Oryza meyeriana var. granulata]|uniref:Uncharacterized protein n=1 Tax=Oryza meyeriana var. granulata TaxID=110450 RepID=A0A6G1F2W3_9ORYZ|nr:hypothetical protein E2562_002594 [Oryza meyeriana var. granulata]